MSFWRIPDYSEPWQVTMDTNRKHSKASPARPPLVSPTYRSDVVRFDPMRAPASAVEDADLDDAVADIARGTSTALSLSLQRTVLATPGQISRQRASSVTSDRVVWMLLNCENGLTGVLLLPMELVAGLGELIMGSSTITGRIPSAVEVQLVCAALEDAVKRWHGLGPALGVGNITPGSVGSGSIPDALEGKEITTIPLDISINNTSFTILVCIPVAPTEEPHMDFQESAQRIADVPLEVAALLPPVVLPLGELQTMRVGSRLATGIFERCLVDLVCDGQLLAVGVLSSFGNSTTVLVDHLEGRE
jgi:hypothetical protein